MCRVLTSTLIILFALSSAPAVWIDASDHGDVRSSRRQKLPDDQAFARHMGWTASRALGLGKSKEALFYATRPPGVGLVLYVNKAQPDQQPEKSKGTNASLISSNLLMASSAYVKADIYTQDCMLSAALATLYTDGRTPLGVHDTVKTPSATARRMRLEWAQAVLDSSQQGAPYYATVLARHKLDRLTDAQAIKLLDAFHKDGWLSDDAEALRLYGTMLKNSRRREAATIMRQAKKAFARDKKKFGASYKRYKLIADEILLSRNNGESYPYDVVFSKTGFPCDSKGNLDTSTAQF